MHKINSKQGSKKPKLLFELQSVAPKENVRRPAGPAHAAVVQHGTAELRPPDHEGHPDHRQRHEDGSEGDEEGVQEDQHR